MTTTSQARKMWQRALGERPPQGIRPIHDSGDVPPRSVGPGVTPSQEDLARADAAAIERVARNRYGAPLGWDEDARYIGIRGPKGRFVSAINALNDGVPDEWFWRTAEEAADFMFGQPNPRPVPGLTYRLTLRQAAQARRDRARKAICPICEEPLMGKRSNAETCGKARCRKAFQRRQRATKFSVAHSPIYDRYVPLGARRIEVDMDPLHQLLDQTITALWHLPAPPGYPDELEWRKGQLLVVHHLLDLERESQHPSLPRLRHRCRAYIAQQRRLWKTASKGQ